MKSFDLFAELQLSGFAFETYPEWELKVENNNGHHIDDWALQNGYKKSINEKEEFKSIGAQKWVHLVHPDRKQYISYRMPGDIGLNGKPYFTDSFTIQNKK